MQEMNQGENYEEQGFEEDDSLDYDESAENTTAQIDTIYGIPKQKFIIGVAIVVVILLFVLLIFLKPSKDTSEEVVYPEETVTPIQTVPDGPTACYDAAGNMLGNCDNLIDGFSIYDSNGNTVGFINSAGTTPFYSADGISLGNYDPSDVTSTDNLSGDVYSDIDDSISVDEDNKLLRKMGYTGDEIELAKATGVPTETLVDAAQALRDEEAADALKRMSKKSSKEFKYIVDNSIFSLPEITFDSFNPDVESSRSYTGSYVVNADYVKLPTYGNQLWIKVKIANATYAMYCVTPERWETLPESGNIVMQISYTMYGTNTINMYITNMTEIDTTQITVNAQDSGSELSDILEDNRSVVTDSSEDLSEETSTDNWW